MSACDKKNDIIKCWKYVLAIATHCLHNADYIVSAASASAVAAVATATTAVASMIRLHFFVLLAEAL